ncbi:anion exchange protein 3 isoform X1 [Oreochromis niloticus]|uniref:anion exchange protein 3 isoform X1 n=1 Tax=Oreochromis niloticus TaxID=8128 RepID=UPI00022B1660|nr:anion exchange protein 3 isoform X1 [Oreochromis niloticus]XP_013125711.1 anion exchange protein 3 isoform X1 [Oreochromis niloticus]XP_013125712.1 anion exchange protein 3 isoform X1 [Oreochromis niloticus]XP_013125713.1 anion exchange protein 3 isoform X1 [Oreochromis niloticus]
MATGGHAPDIDVLINLQQVRVEEEDEDGCVEDQEEEEEEENWEKALSVERFADIISDSASTSGDRMGRHYTEKDFEYHRHTFHHMHHPLSTHLPVPQRLRKRVHSMEKRRKKKRRKKKTSLPPSDVTPTIHEVDEEEAESETEGQGVAATPTELPEIQPQFSLGSQEDLGEPLHHTIVHTENVEQPLSRKTTALTLIKEAAHNGGITVTGQNDDMDGGEAACNSVPSGSDPSSSVTPHGWFRKKPVHHRLLGTQRSNYDLRERICIGSMTALETAVYQQVPTDEAEAQMLVSADLDDMKSHRFEDNPGVRRHLVKKSSRCHMSRTSNSSTPLCSLKKKKRAAEKKTHELFVELNELIVEKDHEMRWKERARWIKFEEDVDDETDRWGKPHVASLSFRSLLELRRTITHGAILLDLEQTSLPGIAHLVVETMIISDQIKAEDRPNVLRALLLKHSHLSDHKTRFHRHHSSGSLHGSFNHNHVHDTNQPLVSEEHDEHHEHKGPVYDPKQDVFVSLFKSLHPLPETHPATARSIKLLAKIPKDAEAVIVLVGCVEFLEQPAMAFVRLSEAVLLESVLEVPVPVRFIFVLLGPSQSNMDYHEIGRSFSTLMSDKNFHEVAYFADDRQDLLNGINEFLDYSIVIPPSDVEGKDLLKTVADFQKQMLRKRKERELKKHSSLIGVESEIKEVSPEEEEEGEQEVDPLKRSGMPFGGLIHDIRRRYPQYVSDLKDALDMQCIAAVIFIYFAALSPTITFGGLLGEKTEGMMGVTELIVSTATIGVIFSLFAGQPLLITGFSGPLLVFEEAFYKFCQVYNFEYLTGRVWIGFWLIFIVLVIVAAEGSFLVRYISPFTQEIFAFLISLIFIYETFSKLIKVFKEHPLMAVYPTDASGSQNLDGPIYNQPNTALLSLVLMMGTFFVAFFLRKFRNSRFLGGKARRIIGDFGIPISILVSVLVDYAITDTYTQKLNVPSGFSVTSPDKRGWFISPFGDKKPFPTWMMGASVVPALLVFILIFMETQITSLIVSKKERRLVKGSGFHLDLLLIVILGALCPLFGLPWLTAATVRSVTHVNALTVMSKATAPGEKPMIQEVKEQRLTGLLVAVLVGMSIVMTDILRLIPLAVLFGIFLYMGVTSLTGIQLYERITLMVTPAKHHPDHIYVTKVKTWRMNMFTIIQLACIVALWVVKSTAASLAFPFVLIMTVPLRRLILSRIFEERELQALDCDEDSPNFDEDGRDEYNEIHMLV